MLIAFHKPFGIISQFTSRRLAKSSRSPNLGFQGSLSIGRLDADSEGLLRLSDEPEWNERLLHPRHAHEREYWAQVERVPAPEALKNWNAAFVIQGRKTLPCRAWMLEPQPEVRRAVPGVTVGRHSREARGRARADDAPTLPPRDPPIRFRKNVPDCWIGLELIEGKNRQVRRLTAAIGHPTLRLVRVRIGNFWPVICHPANGGF